VHLTQNLVLQIDDSAWGANVNYFITPAVAVGASYVNANAVNADLDTQTVGLNAKFRF
jgi:phosphate-selective porin